MNRTFNYQISIQDHQMRIGDFLQMKGYSRHIRTFLKQRPGSVLLNGEPALFYQFLTEGDRLTVHLFEEEASEKILPVPLPVDIVYEDEDLLIVNKKPDTPIHPSQGNYENTLANGIAWYYASQNQPFVYRCINRLDRDTTGLLILAKNMLSGAILSAQMKNREIHRTYLAIVEGCPPENGTVSAPIGRVGSSVIQRQVDEVHGDAAVTHFARLAYRSPETLPLFPRMPAEGLSLVRLRLETGRTHQIRVHMTCIGHPLPGDTLYNPGTALMKRQALHSYSLEFIHPITGEKMHFTCPLPEDMARFFPGIS
ncbi:MAG: RluA family pseudouridine synthase [Clostridiales bacterium]|nr:RluA family pseudouridine synthase [Clostridiales bacterium]